MVEVNYNNGTPEGQAFGSGTLLSDGGGIYILTAAHVVCNDTAFPVPPGTLSVTFNMPSGPVVVQVANTYVNPNWTGNVAQGGDLAIIQLASPAPAVAEAFDIDRSTASPLFQTFSTYGYGESGQGVSGETTVPGTMLWGENRWEATGPTLFPTLSPNILLYDFVGPGLTYDSFVTNLGIHDGPNDINTTNLFNSGLEVVQGNGDSGGPEFLNGLIAGITDFGASPMNGVVSGPNSSSYGWFEGDVEIAPYAPWIDQITSGGSGEILVNTATMPPFAPPAVPDQYMSGNQMYSSVAMDSAGGFVVTWTSQDEATPNGNSVYARQFDTSANPIAAPFLVNTTIAGDEQHSTVSMDAAGDFTIAWESNPQNGSSSSNYGIYAQSYARVSDIGNPQVGPNGRLNGQFQVDTAAGDFRYPSIAEDATGDTMVVFSGQGSTPGIIAVRSDQAADTAGPVVADVLNVVSPSTTSPNTSYQLVREGTILNDSPAPTSFVVDFGEDVIHDSSRDPDSVTNPANWTLSEGGSVISGAVASIAYSDPQSPNGTGDGKYEALITFNQPLSDGQYALTVNAYVEDPSGNPLDGNLTGITSGNFSRSFSVGTGSTEAAPAGSGNPSMNATDIQIDSDLFATLGLREDTPVVAEAPDGSFVAVWTTFGANAIEGNLPPDSLTQGNIMAQRFDKYGEPEGHTFIVNAGYAGDQEQPAIAMDSSGNFVAAGRDRARLWAKALPPSTPRSTATAFMPASSTCTARR